MMQGINAYSSFPTPEVGEFTLNMIMIVITELCNKINVRRDKMRYLSKLMFF